MAREEAGTGSAAQPRSLTRRVSGVFIPGEGASSGRVAGSVVAGTVAVAGTSAGIAEAVSFASHHAALMATASPDLVTAGVAAGGAALLGSAIGFFSDDTPRHSAEEAAHWNGKVEGACRRVQAVGIRVALGTGVAAAGAVATGHGAAAHDIAFATALAAGSWAGLHAVRGISRAVTRQQRGVA